MSPCAVSAPRLFLDAPLSAGEAVPLDRSQANYLLNVLRLKAADTVLVFNGRDGEWRAELRAEGRKAASLVPESSTRPQPPPANLNYLFAPLKHARLDYMVQKAVEMGAGILQPVVTRRTQSQRVNLDRMRANAIEAAEQCGILAIPEIRAETKLPAALEALDLGRLLVFCDEEAPLADPIEALGQAGAHASREAGLAVLIGPEGGFTAEERALVAARAPSVRISLGPRILRADTAAVAALALVQAAIGDWR